MFRLAQTYCRRIWSVLAVLLFVLTSINVQAERRRPDASRTDKKLQSLIRMRSRPTIAQTEQRLKPWPRRNPYGYQTDEWGNEPALSKLIRDEAPLVIAQLERAFPGAKYAFLGRDSVLLADIVDAFYRAHGDYNRVVRLNASGSSINNVSDRMLLKFLASNGLSLKTVDKLPPFIIIDGTNYHLHSQSRRYITAFYTAYQRRGLPLRRLVKKVNVIDISKQGGNVVDGFDPNDFLRRQARTVQTTGPQEIMHVDGTSFYHSTEWHDTFGPLRILASGKVSARPGELGDREDRDNVLADQIDIINVTSTDSFYRSVRRAAREIGYTFPDLAGKKGGAPGKRKCSELLRRRAA